MLKGKTALVTGASRGIGRAIAEMLALNGANVALNYRNDSKAVEEVVDVIKQNGGNAIAIKADVSDFEQAKGLINKTIEEFKSIDILVNNAGITKDNLMIRMSENDFDSVVEVNLKGTFNCLKHISSVMLKQRSGKIINISSIIGLTGNIGQSNYAASKAGIIAMTKSVAKELGSRGITVNAVAPGFINTEMTQVLSDNIKQTYIKAIPLNRMGEADEVAKVVCFLASNAADYITGQVIQVDGGMVM